MKLAFAWQVEHIKFQILQKPLLCVHFWVEDRNQGHYLKQIFPYQIVTQHATEAFLTQKLNVPVVLFFSNIFSPLINLRMVAAKSK